MSSCRISIGFFRRAQIMAYRLLARNQPLSQQMVNAVQGKRPDGTPQCPTPPSSPFQPQGVLGQPQPVSRGGPDWRKSHVRSSLALL